MMQRLLETHDLRKITILFELSLNLEPVNMYNLAKQLSVNIKTLLSTINAINQDAEFYHQGIRIKRYSRNQLKLEVANNSSMSCFKLRYLKKSMSYQILDAIFNLSYQNIQMMADTYHISVTTIHRKLSKPRELLNIFELELNFRYKFPIKGSEKQIRFFFFQFYWYSTQVFEWPFTNEMKKICLNLYEKVFIHQFKTKNVIMKEKILLWLAINMIRIKGGFRLSSEDVKDMELIIKSNTNYKTLKRRFNQYFPYGSIKFEAYDFMLFYCLLICGEDHFNDNEFAFFTLAEKERTVFEEATLLFLTKLVQYLKRPLSHEEQYNLYKNLLRIHMHAFFFPQKELFLTLDQQLDYIKQSYHDSLYNFDKFYHDLYPTHKKFQIYKDNPNLYQKYMLLLVNNLDIKTFHPEITIALSTLDSKNREIFYQQKIQSLTTSPIHFVNETIEAVDLVISYSPFNLDPDLNCFILNSPVTSWDWELLKLELESIQRLKRGR